MSTENDVTSAPGSSVETATLQATADKFVAEGKKAFALKQWEEAVGKYADALEIRQDLVGDQDPSMAPLLLAYGKALFELAVSQQGVMGKEEVNKEASSRNEASSSKFVFSADPTSDDEDTGDAADGEGEGNGDHVGDTSIAQTAGPEDGDQDGDEPEDDYNAAWEVLDVARTIYAKIAQDSPEDDSRDVKLSLAECHLCLGDVSCETENFPQAVQDYKAALEIQTKLLPPSSRVVASVNYQLASALEFVPEGRDQALSHVEKALLGFKARKAELESSNSEIEEIKKLGEKEKEVELKEVGSLIGDLEVKIEELKTAPPATDFVSESIDHLLGSSSTSTAPAAVAGPVNDLTSMVRKKAPKVVKQVEAVVASAKDAGEAVKSTVEEAAAVVGEAVNGSDLPQMVKDGKRKAEEIIEGEGKKLKGE